ncbi:COG3014 family protein [Nitrospira sp. Kam-Ns4a]
MAAALAACTPATSRYTLVEASLRARNPAQADLVIEQAKDEYRAQDRVLYLLDRGMTLHLAGRYAQSNQFLQEADEAIEALYTRRLRTETKAFLVNDTELPFEGASHEQVLINVVKALNYALLGNLTDALVEARLIDQRLNRLADRTTDRGAYREDPFARYLTGLLYEAARDLNNAFIAYRKAYDAYQAARSWLRVPVPPGLEADLLRITDALHLQEEHAGYRTQFPTASWQPYAETERLAQLVVISYNGRAPYKQDQFIDLPISFEALKLVLLTKGILGASNQSSQDRRAMESVLYGLNGRVVRVALPRLVRQPTDVAYDEISLAGSRGTYTAKTDLVHDLGAAAEKTLSDQYAQITLKAVARAAVKFTLAEGVSYGAQAAAGRDAGPLVGLVVNMVAKTLAVASEEADKRSWRTLPDQIQIARVWVPPGVYQVRVHPVGRRSGVGEPDLVEELTLEPGRTAFVVARYVS